MRGKRNGFFLFISFVFVMVLLWGLPSQDRYAYGDEKAKKNLPPRAILVAPEYTGIVVEEGEDVSIDITVTNGGRQDENIELTLPSVPKGWTARIKTYSFGVTGIYVGSDKSKPLTLKAEPDKGTGPGKYVFTIKAKTTDGRLTSSSQVTLMVKAKQEVKKAKGVNITTSYPVLQGPTDAKFEFSLEVENKTDKDSIFNLSYEGPENWGINFKPAYEDKYFSSLRIKEGQSATMAVEVKPFLLAEPGEYPIKVKVNSEKAKAVVQLMVVLTGTHKMDIGTANGLLSLNAFQGKPANLSFYVKNSGSATQDNVRFLSFKPENWKVDFNPKSMNTLAPGDLKQVEVNITPAEQALVGDYSVGINVEGGKATKSMELRVTVRASTAWGWIGIGIIVLVIIGLVTLFIKMGRR